MFTLGAGLKLTAASVGAALVGLAADAPAAALLTGIAALLLAAALLHLLMAPRGPRPAADAVTAPWAASPTAAAGRRNPGGR